MRTRAPLLALLLIAAASVGPATAWIDIHIGQYTLAEHNSFTFTIPDYGLYTFTNGYINEQWWESELGTEKTLSGPGNPNLNADTHADDFSFFSDFTVDARQGTGNLAALERIVRAACDRGVDAYSLQGRSIAGSARSRVAPGLVLYAATGPTRGFSVVHMEVW